MSEHHQHSLETISNLNELRTQAKEEILTLEQLIDAHRQLYKLKKYLECSQESSEDKLDTIRHNLSAIVGFEHIDQNAEYTQESLGDFIKSIGQGFRNLRHRISNRRRAIFDNIQQELRNLETREQRLNQTIEQLKRSPVDTTTDKVTVDFGKYLHIDGTMEPEKFIDTFIERDQLVVKYRQFLYEFAQELLAHVRQYQNRGYRTLIDVNESGGSSIKAQIEIAKLQYEARVQADELTQKYQDTSEEYLYQELPGGMVFVPLEDPFFLFGFYRGEEEPIIPKIENRTRMGSYKEREEVSVASIDQIDELIKKSLNPGISDLRGSFNTSKEIVTAAESLEDASEYVTPIIQKFSEDVGLVDVNDIDRQIEDVRHARKLSDEEKQKKIEKLEQDRRILIEEYNEQMEENVRIAFDNFYGNHLMLWMSFLSESIMEYHEYRLTTLIGLTEYIERMLGAYRE